MWVGGWAQLWLGGQYRSKLVLLQVEGSTVVISTWLRYTVPFPCHNGTAPYFSQVLMTYGTAPSHRLRPPAHPQTLVPPNTYRRICVLSIFNIDLVLPKIITNYPT